MQLFVLLHSVEKFFTHSHSSGVVTLCTAKKKPSLFPPLFFVAHTVVTGLSGTSISSSSSSFTKLESKLKKAHKKSYIFFLSQPTDLCHFFLSLVPESPVPVLLPAAHCPEPVPDRRVGQEVDDGPGRSVAQLPQQGDSRELNLVGERERDVDNPSRPTTAGNSNGQQQQQQ